MKTGIQLSNQLDALLQDEDLDQDKMKDAFEGLLPAISDYLNGVGVSPEGASLILRERKEHIEKHGRTVESDVIHNSEDQFLHAIMLIVTNIGFQRAGIDMPKECFEDMKPNGWGRESLWKIIGKPSIDQLKILGSFAAAEIDRLLALEGKEENRG